MSYRIRTRFHSKKVIYIYPVIRLFQNMMLEIQAVKSFLELVASCARIQSEILMGVVFSGIYLQSL